MPPLPYPWRRQKILEAAKDSQQQRRPSEPLYIRREDRMMWHDLDPFASLGNDTHGPPMQPTQWPIVCINS